LATYVYGNYIDEVLTWIGRADLLLPPECAVVVMAITDSTANVVEQYSYDAYGCVTVTDGRVIRWLKIPGVRRIVLLAILGCLPGAVDEETGFITTGTVL